MGNNFIKAMAVGATLLSLAGCKSDEELLAQAIYGEGRGCPKEVQIAIGYTVQNRATNGWAWDGETIREVVTKPDQYKCFNPGAGIDNYKATQNPEEDDPRAYGQCLAIARGILSGEIKDPTNGATHFYEVGTAPPFWTRPEKKGRMEEIGRIQTSEGPSKVTFFKEKWRQNGKRNR